MLITDALGREIVSTISTLIMEHTIHPKLNLSQEDKAPP